MADIGYIKLHRRILEWRYFNDPVMLRAWIWLLLHANWQDEQKGNNLIRRGEVAFKYKEMQDDLGLSHDQVKRAIQRLREDRALKMRPSVPPKGALAFCIVTICKWEEYQCEIESARPNSRPNSRPKDVPNGKEVSPRTPFTRNRLEEIKKKEKPSLIREGKKKVSAAASTVSFCSLSNDAALKKRREDFSREVYAIGGGYAGEMVDTFIGYWTQTVGDGDQMAWEQEKAKRGFSVEARLKKWVKNEWKQRGGPRLSVAEVKQRSEERETLRVEREAQMTEDEIRSAIPEGYTPQSWLIRLRTLRDEGNQDAGVLLSAEARNIPIDRLIQMRERLR